MLEEGELKFLCQRLHMIKARVGLIFKVMCGLEGTVHPKGTPLEFQFDVYTASVGGKDGTYSV
jgi:hypothetical protein